jgi:hypothetical protein
MGRNVLSLGEIMMAGKHVEMRADVIAFIDVTRVNGFFEYQFDS